MTNHEIASRTAAALRELYLVWGQAAGTGGSTEARAAGTKARKALALAADHAERSDRTIANRRYQRRIAANRPW